jgi:O-antigen/teichoic acid export membrane protein
MCMDKETTIKKAVSGIAWDGSTKLITQILTWVSTIVVARILTPDDYGIVAISGVFIGVLLIVTDMGLMSSLINMKQVQKDDYDSVFWLNMLLSVALYILIYFIAPLVGKIYQSEILIDIMRMSGFILPISALKIVPQAIAMRDMNFKYRALVEMAGSLVGAVSSVIMALNGCGVWSLIYAVLFGQAVVVLFYMPLLKSIPKIVLNVSRVKHIASYGLYLMGAQILGFVTKRSDVMIMGIFIPEHDVGIYSMAFHLSAIPLDKIGAIFTRILFPAISRLKDDSIEARNLFISIHKYLLLITYPLLIGMVFTADDIIPLLFTEKWEGLIPLIQGLCILNLLRISGMVMPTVIAALGYSRIVFQFTLLNSIVLPVAFLVGAQYGLSGILISWFLVYPLFYFFLLNILSKKIDMRIRQLYDTSRSAMMCTIIMAVSLFIFKAYINFNTHVMGIVFTVVLGVVVYAIANFTLFGGDIAAAVKRISALRSK